MLSRTQGCGTWCKTKWCPPTGPKIKWTWRQSVKHTFKLHIWERFYLSKDLYLCTSISEICLALPHGRHSCLVTWLFNITVKRCSLVTSLSPACDWTRKDLQQADEHLSVPSTTVSTRSPVIPLPLPVGDLLYMGRQKLIPDWGTYTSCIKKKKNLILLSCIHIYIMPQDTPIQHNVRILCLLKGIGSSTIMNGIWVNNDRKITFQN